MTPVSDSQRGAKLYSQAKVPLAAGEFVFQVYHDAAGCDVVVVAAVADLAAFDAETSTLRAALRRDEAVFVRIHSECLTGEAFGSKRCDCGAQLEAALQQIAARGQGVVVYLRQEGRGIGLGNKLRAYALQDRGWDTVEANLRLGFEADLRDFEIAGEILRHHLGLERVELHTNNPAKVAALRRSGLEITRVCPAIASLCDENRAYLSAKYHRMGHDLGALFAAGAAPA